jgi:hypothetical protein
MPGKKASNASHEPPKRSTKKKRVKPSDLASGPIIAFEAIDKLSRAHYRGLSAAELLGRLDTPLGQRQFARLIGVMLKQPFADDVRRPPSKSTKSIIALHWKPEDKVKKLAPGTWQFSTMRALLDANSDRRLSDKEALSELMHFQYESGLAKFILQAFRDRICGNPVASKALNDAIKQAKKAGVDLTTPTTAHLSVGLAATVAVSVASLMPAAVAAVGAPVIGGIALLLIHVGVKGFCEWSKKAVKEAEAIEKSG